MDYYIPLAPVPASRPRVSKWGVYYCKRYTGFMNAFKVNCPPPEKLLRGLVEVQAEFICRRPKKVTRETPVGDVDNYAKALLDGLTKMGFWVDDDQVTTAWLYKRYAIPGEEPHIYVRINERGSSNAGNLEDRTGKGKLGSSKR